MNWEKISQFAIGVLRIDVGLPFFGIASVLGTWFMSIVGWDEPVRMLVILVGIDYVTGFYAAWKTDNLNWRKGAFGIPKKVIVFAIVWFASVLDGAMQTHHLLRSMVIFGYAANEGLSIIENIDRMGYGGHIPFFIRNKLERLKEEKLK